MNASNALLRPSGIAAKRDHQRPGRGRRRERIAHEARLADTGLASDECDAGTVAGAEHAGETLQLAVAPDDPIRRVLARLPRPTTYWQTVFAAGRGQAALAGAFTAGRGVRQTVSDGRPAGRPGALQEPMQLGVPAEPVSTCGVVDVERVHVDLLSFSRVVIRC